MLKLEALLRRHWSHSFVDSSFKLNMCDRDLTYRWAECIPTSLFWSTQMSHPVNTGRRSNRQSDTVLMEQIWCDQYRNNQSAIALMFWQTNTNRYHLCVCVSERWLEITAVCVCRGPYCGFGFVYELSGLYVVWICYFIIYLQFMCMCVFPANYSSVWTTVCLHLWDWSKCPCVITSLCVCGPDFLP